MPSLQVIGPLWVMVDLHDDKEQSHAADWGCWEVLGSVGWCGVVLLWDFSGEVGG